jgi:hypothetical protein
MSITKSANREYVIIRAFGDEPVKLRPVAVREGAIDVVGSDEATPMPFHRDRAYRFEEAVFEELRSAYETGEGERLHRLWEQARRFDSER